MRYIAGILLIILTKFLIPFATVDTKELYSYCKENKLNTDYCILVDFSRL